MGQDVISESHQIIIGIDPGSRVTGFGVVAEIRGELKCIEFGTLQSAAKAPLSERLLEIGQGLEELFKKYKPYAAAIEKTFFAKNVDSVTKLSHARGVCLYEAARAKVKVFEYTPTEIKLNIVGHGRAGKDQVQMLVRQLLNLKNIPIDKFDMSDALALAIHHCRVAGTVERMRERELTR